MTVTVIGCDPSPLTVLPSVGLCVIVIEACVVTLSDASALSRERRSDTVAWQWAPAPDVWVPPLSSFCRLSCGLLSKHGQNNNEWLINRVKALVNATVFYPYPSVYIRGCSVFLRSRVST